MRTEGQTMRRHEAATLHLDLETVKGWAKATFTKQRMVDVALCAATASIIGVVLSSLQRAMENGTIVPF